MTTYNISKDGRNIANTREYFITFPNTEKRVENMTRSGVFLLGNAMKLFLVFDISAQYKQLISFNFIWIINEFEKYTSNISEFYLS